MYTHAGTEYFDPAVTLVPCIQKYLYGTLDGKSAVLPEALGVSFPTLQDSAANWALSLLKDDLEYQSACSFFVTSWKCITVYYGFIHMQATRIAQSVQ